MYIISTLKANIMYTRVYNVRIGPSDVLLFEVDTNVQIIYTCHRR